MIPTEHQAFHHKVGLFSIGLAEYWSQFPGLRPRLESYNRIIQSKLESLNTEVINLGLIDSPERATAAGHAFRQADVDLLFLHVATYALSSTVLPVVRRAGVPVVVLNLSPQAAIDYQSFNSMGDRAAMTGEWLVHCQSCAVPEISNVFFRSSTPFHQVTGMLEGDPSVWSQIGDWVAASHAVFAMEHNRLGVIGHYYSGMHDIYSDLTLQSFTFGTQIEMLEADELTSLRRAVSTHDLQARIAEIHEAFDVEPGVSAEQIESAARTSVALDQLVQQHHLGSLAYYYKGSGVPENEDTLSSIIPGCSLLTARGIPVAGELEIKNAQAMKILDLLGAGGSFTEFYANDFTDDVILMGHDGPGHMAIAQGKPRLRPLRVYHGKVGRGLSIEMSVKHGPVTLLSVAENGNRGLKLVVAEAESVPGPILKIGNTNSRYRFPIQVREFLERWSSEGPAHHCAVGVGHVSAAIKKFARLCNIDFVRVC